MAAPGRHVEVAAKIAMRPSPEHEFTMDSFLRSER